MTQLVKRGLIDRIRVADTEQEVESLLREGDKYEQAHDFTRKRWIKAAKRRKKELE